MGVGIGMPLRVGYHSSMNGRPPQDSHGSPPPASVDLTPPESAEEIPLAANGAGPLTGADDAFGFAQDSEPRGSAEIAAGSRIGDVTILRLLAEGGMGRVYEARQERPARGVAVKVLREATITADLARRFAHEADLLGGLRHPCIAQVYAAGTFPGLHGDRPFIIMELVEGAMTIAAFASAKRSGLRERVAIFAKACAGIAYAHRQGIIHRDIKPGNILVDQNAQPKVIDFGVARSLHPEAERLTTATQQGELIGTVRYMSPEQLGLDTGQVGTQSDTYAAGLVLHELLLGDLPYELRGRSVMEAACVLAAASGVATGPLAARLRRGGLTAGEANSLAAVVAQCLEPAPADRYATASELEADLTRWLQGEPVMARPPTLAESLARFARRHRAATAAAGIVLASLMAAVVSISTFWLQAERQRLTAEESRNIADERRQEAERQTGEARHQLYLSTVLLAAEARDRDNLAEARRLLAEARSLAAERGREPIELDCLAASLDESLAVLPNLGSTIASVAFAPDGLVVAIGTMAGQLQTWRPGQASAEPTPVVPEHVIAAHEAAIWDLAISPDGRLVASASADETCRIHNLASGELVHSITKHAAAFYGTHFSPDGGTLATSSRDRTIRLWDTATWQPRGVLEGHAGTVYSVRFSPDGERLVSASQDGSLRVWSVAAMRELVVIPASTERIFRASFSPDGQRLAAASEDGTASVWDAASGRLIRSLRHPQRVNAVAFVAGGDQLATASGDGLLRCFDLIDGSETCRRRGHAEAIWSLAGHPDSAGLVTGSADGTARTWNVSDEGEPLLRFGDRAQALTISADGSMLAAGDAAGMLRLVDVNSLTDRAAIPIPAGRINSVAFAPHHAGLLAAACDDGSVQRWHVAEGRLLDPLAVHTRRVYDVTFSPDGQTLATGSEDRTARLVDAVDGRERLAPLRHPARVFGTAFDPTGRQLATACGDRRVRLWSVSDGRELAAWDGHEGPVNWVSFSPDGSRLASASSDGTVRLWNPTEGTPTRVLTGAARQVWRVAFSPDGTRVAATVADGTVQLWDEASGRPVAVLRGHADQAWGLAFAPGGHLLATASWDRTVRLWGVSVAALARERVGRE